MISANSKAVQKNFRNCNILLIEDNPGHIEIISSAVKICIPEVNLIIASNAGVATELLDEITSNNGALPKLILLDLYLPRREDGWNLLLKIKLKSSPFAMVPVIVLSNSENAQDIKEAYNLGCSAYTIKPLEFCSWLTYFENVRHHWLETVILPYTQD